MQDTAQQDEGCSCTPVQTADLRTPDEPASHAVADLIPFILERFHETHRRELPDLVRLARKVEAVHAARPECPIGLAQMLAGVAQELDAHMQKEEQVLFPLLLASGGGCAPFAIQRMRAEHRDHEDALSAMKQLAHGFVAPAGACGTWQRLYAGCAKLAADLEAHIALENDVLFPQFE